MRRYFGLLACLGALSLAACTGETSLPEASGKGSIRAINAIPNSGSVNFLIEERLINAIPYKSVSTTQRYDDLDYTFNFDVFFAGRSSPRRVASQYIDVEANRDYTLFISGTVNNPTLTLWEDDERNFNADDSVFAAKFTHAAASLETVDYYFAEPGTAPVLGNAVATLSFGEVAPAADFEQGDYVLTITVADDPNTVLYVSDITTFNGRSTYFLAPFDGDADDTGPIIAHALSGFGGVIAMPDPTFPSRIEFVNTSLDLGTTDIYDDEELTSRIVADHAYLDVTPEREIASDTQSFYYTPAGDTSVVSLEGVISAFPGTRYRMIAHGTAGSFSTSVVIPDRVPVGTQAKLKVFHTSGNFDFVDVYAVERGESIEGTFPTRAALGRLVPVDSVALAPGSYDLYVTEFSESVVLAGPYAIDVAVNDIVDLIIVDTVDPALLDILFLSGGPAP